MSFGSVLMSVPPALNKMTCVLLGGILKPHSSAHCSMICSAICMILIAYLMFFADFHIALSSANCERSMPSSVMILLSASFSVCMIALKSVGLMTLPCGDPLSSP